MIYDLILLLEVLNSFENGHFLCKDCGDTIYSTQGDNIEGLRCSQCQSHRIDYVPLWLKTW